MNNNEIFKYCKNKTSVSRTFFKSKHKHQYIDCLLILKNKPYKAQCCTICGKIGNLNVCETERVPGGYRLLTNNEFYEKYNGIIKFEINSISQKYVDGMLYNKN